MTFLSFCFEACDSRSELAAPVSVDLGVLEVTEAGGRRSFRDEVRVSCALESLASEPILLTCFFGIKLFEICFDIDCGTSAVVCVLRYTEQGT